MADLAAELPDDVAVVATSYEMEWYAAAAGFSVVPLDDDGVVVAFDGADQVDPSGALVKGRGGAMGRERAVLAGGRARADRGRRRPSGSTSSADARCPLELRPSGIFATVDVGGGRRVRPVVLRSGSGKDGPVHDGVGRHPGRSHGPRRHGHHGGVWTPGSGRWTGSVDTGYFAPSAKRELVTG